ncbi:MAG: hypothetical protein WCG25_01720 [bacterium]
MCACNMTDSNSEIFLMISNSISSVSSHQLVESNDQSHSARSLFNLAQVYNT